LRPAGRRLSAKEKTVAFLHHTPTVFEHTLVDRCRHTARWLRAAAGMSTEERAFARAMQTPLAVVKPMNAKARGNKGLRL
jgi:hypothetical protein